MGHLLNSSIYVTHADECLKQNDLAMLASQIPQTNSDPLYKHYPFNWQWPLQAKLKIINILY